MFEKLEERGRHLALGRAERKQAAIAERLAALLPAGITVDIVEGGVTISGRNLRRRAALNAELRRLL